MRRQRTIATTANSKLVIPGSAAQIMTLAGGLSLWLFASASSAAPFLDDFSTDTSANYTLEDSFGTGGSFDVSGGTLNITTGANNTATVSTLATVPLAVGESLGVDVVDIAAPEGVFLTLSTVAGQPGGPLGGDGYRWRRDASSGGDGIRIFAADGGIVLSGTDTLHGSPATLWIDWLSTDTFEFQIQALGGITRTSFGTHTYAALSGMTDFHIGVQAFDAAVDAFPFDNLRIVETASIGDIDLTLVVDRGTGGMTLHGDADSAVTILGYAIQSERGALDQTGWTSISGNYDFSGNRSVDNDDDWTVLTAPGSHTNLSELELDGGNGAMLAAGATIDLSEAGGAWIKNLSEADDVTMRVLFENGLSTQVSVEFEGNDGNPFELGDLDFNGAINEQDWLVFVGGHLQDLTSLTQAQSYGMGDLDDDGDNDLADFRLFKTAFDNANGSGAFTSMLAAVPEPSSLALFVLVGCVLGADRARKGYQSLRRLFSTAGQKCNWISALLVGLILASSASAAPFLDDFNTDTSANYTLEDSFGTGGLFDVSGGTLNVTTGADNTATVSTLATVPFAVGESLGVDVIDIVAPEGVFLTLSTVAGQPGGPLGGDSYRWRRDASSGGEGIRIQAGASIILAGVDPFHGDPAMLWIDRTSADTFEFQIQALGGITRTSFGTHTYAALSGVTDFHIGVQAYDAAADSFPFDNLRIVETDLIDNPPALTLTVNTTTGNAFIQNSSGANLDIDYYLVQSAAGALDPTGWNSLDDQNFDSVGGGIGESWDEGAGVNEFQLAELFLQGSSMFADDDSVNLGKAFNPSVFGSGNDGDLEFINSLTSEEELMGNVVYVTGSPGDYNGDGFVNAVDYALWRNTLGTQGQNFAADGDGSEEVDAGDYQVWRQNFGAENGSASLATAAVPEPATILLLCVAMAGLSTMSIRRRGLQIACAYALALFVACIFSAGTADATVTNDREYHFGDPGTADATLVPPTVDVAANVEEGNPMGFTLGGVTSTGDEIGPSGGGFIDLEVFGPTYTSAAGRPDASGGDFAANFDGTDDFLRGARLGLPETSDSATGGGGPLNYDGISNRGFQFWVRPNSAANGTAQSLVADTQQHGVRISSAGTWVMRYGGAEIDSSTAVNFDDWSHLMLVRPFGAAGSGSGSRLYVNGIAVASSPGGYDGADDTDLVVGANSGDMPGTVDFFRGAIDDLEMFVLGEATTAPFEDYGTFDYATDNPIASATLTGVDGDVNQDGFLTSADVDDFIDGWLSVHLVNGVQVGDFTTITDGDLNFDGITDLDDAYLLHDALVSSGMGGLTQFGFGVPEPASITLLLGSLAAIVIVRRRSVCRG